MEVFAALDYSGGTFEWGSRIRQVIRNIEMCQCKAKLNKSSYKIIVHFLGGETANRFVSVRLLLAGNLAAVQWQLPEYDKNPQKT